MDLRALRAMDSMAMILLTTWTRVMMGVDVATETVKGPNSEYMLNQKHFKFNCS